jgi:hypothetical protein
MLASCSFTVAKECQISGSEYAEFAAFISVDTAPRLSATAPPIGAYDHRKQRDCGLGQHEKKTPYITHHIQTCTSLSSVLLCTDDNMPTSTLTENIKIPQNGEPGQLARSVSRSQTNNSIVSTSPTEHFRRPSRSSFGHEGTSPLMRRMTTHQTGIPKQLKPFREQDIKILLLENVNVTGIEILKEQGYQVETLKSSLPEDQLIEKIKYVDTIAISSRRQANAELQRCPCPGHPFQNESQLPRSLCGKEPHRSRLLLYRH